VKVVQPSRVMAMLLMAASISNAAEACLNPSMGSIAAQMGLAPEVLLAAGLTPAQGQAMAGRLSNAVEERERLVTAQAQLDASVQHLTEIQRALEADPANAALRSQLNTAAAELRASRQGLRAAKAAVFERMAASLPSATVSRIRSCRRASYEHVTAAIVAASCESTGWEVIEGSLVAESRAHREGESVPQEAAATLLRVRGQAPVIQADMAIGANLEAMRAAFGP
jgi:hypothetical protein